MFLENYNVHSKGDKQNFNDYPKCYHFVIRHINYICICMYIVGKLKCIQRALETGKKRVYGSGLNTLFFTNNVRIACLTWNVWKSKPTAGAARVW